MSEALTVPIALPPSPHVLVDGKWLATLVEIEDRIAKLDIVDAATQQLAADTQVRLTRAGRSLEDARAAIKAPFIKAGRDIDAAAAGPASRISTALNRVRNLLMDFAEKQRIAAAEAERLRQAELARLERIRVAEELEARRKADEIAAAALKKQQEDEARAAEAAKALATPPETLDFAEEPMPEPPPAPPPEKTETEKAIDALKFAPAVAVTRPAGITERVTLRIVSIDVTLLPDHFVIRTADERKIRDLFTVGWKDGQPVPSCPGVQFAIDRMPVSTGRQVF